MYHAELLLQMDYQRVNGQALMWKVSSKEMLWGLPQDCLKVYL